MCLGTVIVGDPAAPYRKVEDVIELTFEETGVAVKTLFGEVQTFSGMRCRGIDLGRGVVVTLEEIG